MAINSFTSVIFLMLSLMNRYSCLVIGSSGYIVIIFVFGDWIFGIHRNINKNDLESVIIAFLETTFGWIVIFVSYYIVYRYQ